MGGTFMDAYMVDSDGNSYEAKADTDTTDLIATTAVCVERLAETVGLTSRTLLPNVTQFVFATTLTTNLLVTRSGPHAGLITTRGHADVLMISGGAKGKVAGLSDDEIRHSVVVDKPEPLVRRETIHEVDERIDLNGRVIVALAEDQVREAALALSGAGVKAVAICFLWSFKNNDHEHRAAEIVAEVAPELDVTCSHDLVPRLGEYLRFSSAVINAYCGPTLRSYLERQAAWLAEGGLCVEPLVMQAPGGVIPTATAARTALYSIGSGPVAGVVGASKLAGELGEPNVICADMGGTTFDVGLVSRGTPLKTSTSVAVRYPYVAQVVDVTSIGAGGGSIAWVDELTGVLKVGPESAGAFPGPAAYGRGGSRPTVTDAAIVLGYINPDRFLGGKMALEADASVRALNEHVGGPLGLSTIAAAHAVHRISNGHMADFLRAKTIENGYDPRDFVLFAYGGAGPLHASALARELDIARVLVPRGNAASVYSALGVLASDVLQVRELTEPMLAPFDGARVGELLRGLRDACDADLTTAGIETSKREIRFSADMRYVGQIYEVEVPLPEVTAEDPDGALLPDRFDRRYSELFGEGAGYRKAGVELITMRATGVGYSDRLPLGPVMADEPPAPTAMRQVHFDGHPATEVEVFDGGQLGLHAVVRGPAIIEMPHTTLVLHHGDAASMRAGGTIQVTIGHPAEPTAATSGMEIR